MKISLRLAILFFAVAFSGVLATKSLHAQRSTAGAYVVAEQEVADPEAFNKQYLPGVAASLEQYGGAFVVRGAPATALEGAPPIWVSIISFPSVEKAMAWRTSEAYQALAPLRNGLLKIRLYVVAAESI